MSIKKESDGDMCVSWRWLLDEADNIQLIMEYVVCILLNFDTCGFLPLS